MSNHPSGDFDAFKFMLTPILAQMLFWITTILSWLLGFCVIAYEIGVVPRGGSSSIPKLEPIFAGVFLFLVVPLVTRIFTECIIVVFKIDSSLSYLCSMKEETRVLAYKRTSYLRDLTNNSDDADKSESDPSDMDTSVDFDDKWK